MYRFIGSGVPDMARENKQGGDLNDIRSQTDDLLKSLDSINTPSTSSPKSASSGSISASSPAKPPAHKSSSASNKTILVAAGSLAGIAVIFIGGLVALEASKQATLNRQAELAAQQARANREAAARVQTELARERENTARELAERERTAKEQAAKEQAAKEQAAREQAAREQAAKEQAARERAAREQAARDREARERKEAERLASLRRQLKSKGWREAGSSGLLYRHCNEESDDSKRGLGADCPAPTGNYYGWFGVEFYCLSTNCSGVVEGTFGRSGRKWAAQERVSLGYIELRPNQRRVFTFKQTKAAQDGGVWLSKAGGYCGDSDWKRC